MGLATAPNPCPQLSTISTNGGYIYPLPNFDEAENGPSNIWGYTPLVCLQIWPHLRKKTSLRPQRRCFDRARLRLQPSINAPTIGAYLVENVLRERDIQKSTSAQRERNTTASTCGQHSSCFRASTMFKIRFEVRARPSER